MMRNDWEYGRLPKVSDEYTFIRMSGQINKDCQ